MAIGKISIFLKHMTKVTVCDLRIDEEIFCHDKQGKTI